MAMQFGHVQREAFVAGTASEGRCRTLLADERGGSHLSARHAVDRVVDEKHGDFFAAVGGMDDLGGADGGEVTIALVRDDDLVGAGALDGGRAGGCAAVGELHVAHVEIVVSENRAADRAHENRLVLQTEFLEGFGNQLVGNAVAAAGTVVRLPLQIALAFVAVVKSGDFEWDFIARSRISELSRQFRSVDMVASRSCSPTAPPVATTLIRPSPMPTSRDHALTICSLRVTSTTDGTLPPVRP